MMLFIKNMVCPRCISSVESILTDTKIDYENVELGKVELKEELTADQELALKEKLTEVGFEIIKDKDQVSISQVKTYIIDKIQHGKHVSPMNISDELSNLLNREYSSISKLFSTLEGVTIERYVILQKIERVKELLSSNESSLYQIAGELNYSSTAHLSSQFKAITGKTPSEFKLTINI